VLARLGPRVSTPERLEPFGAAAVTICRANVRADLFVRAIERAAKSDFSRYQDDE
jgi:hypothetical protein